MAAFADRSTRFSEVEAIAIITVILSRYTIALDTDKFKDVPGETPLQRRGRLLVHKHIITTTPLSIPLVLKRRE